MSPVVVDVGTTKRKPLTPRQRLKLFERHAGICVLCHSPIKAADAWIDEHMLALGLGGSNDPENRGIAHKPCADKKTNGPDGDLAKIAAAKRIKSKHLGIIKKTGLEGRSQDEKKVAKAPKRPSLPFRPMFVDVAPSTARRSR
jgi:5-methylcytosine-specific restriction protein A